MTQLTDGRLYYKTAWGELRAQFKITEGALWMFAMHDFWCQVAIAALLGRFHHRVEMDHGEIYRQEFWLYDVLAPHWEVILC